jgi:hypothetical protein
MEHPTGMFETAVEAMSDAIRRLRALTNWNEWITFCAQGMGPRRDTYHMANIRLLQDLVEVNAPVDIDRIVRLADVPPRCLVKMDNYHSVASASPEQAAKIFDAIFQHHLGIRPHEGEGNDYAIGAEW